MGYTNLKSLSLSLCALALMGCGKAPEIDTQPLMREVQDPLVEETPVKDIDDVTEQYKADLQGTLKSKSGTLNFHDDNKLTIESIVPVRNTSEYYLEDHYLDCEFKRTGTYRIMRSNKGHRFVFEANKIQTVSATFQKRGTIFNLDEAGKERIRLLCEDYAQIELSSPISGKLLSHSKDHLHFYHSPFDGEYDSEKKSWKSTVSKIGDDFTDFYIRESEMNISELFGKYYAGSYESINQFSGNRELSITSENGLLSYELRSESCNDQSNFEVFYNLIEGPVMRVTPQDNCSLLGKSAITVNNFGYEKSYSFINLSLPFGVYNKILSQPDSMRD